MSEIKIVRTVSEIPNNKKWVTANKFKSLGRIVDKNGNDLGKDYKGRSYRIIAKQEYSFTRSKKSLRVFLGLLAVIFSLGLALIAKPIQNLFTLKKKSRHYAVLVQADLPQKLIEPPVLPKKQLELTDQQLNDLLESDEMWNLSQLEPQVITALVQKMLLLPCTYKEKGTVSWISNDSLDKMLAGLNLLPKDHAAIQAFVKGFPAPEHLLVEDTKERIFANCFHILLSPSFLKLFNRLDNDQQKNLLQNLFAHAARFEPWHFSHYDPLPLFDSSLHRDILAGLSYATDLNFLAKLCAHPLANAALVKAILAHNPFESQKSDPFFKEFLLRYKMDSQSKLEWLLDAVFKNENSERQKVLFEWLQIDEPPFLNKCFHHIPALSALPFPAKYKMNLLEMAIALIKENGNAESLAALGSEIAANDKDLYTIVDGEDPHCTQVLQWIMDTVLKSDRLTSKRRDDLLKDLAAKHTTFLAHHLHEVATEWLPLVQSSILSLTDELLQRPDANAEKNRAALAQALDPSKCSYAERISPTFWHLFAIAEAKGQAKFIAATLSDGGSRSKLVNASPEAWRQFGMTWALPPYDWGWSSVTFIEKPEQVTALLTGLAERPGAALDAQVCHYTTRILMHFLKKISLAEVEKALGIINLSNETAGFSQLLEVLQEGQDPKKTHLLKLLFHRIFTADPMDWKTAHRFLSLLNSTKDKPSLSQNSKPFREQVLQALDVEQLLQLPRPFLFNNFGELTMRQTKQVTPHLSEEERKQIPSF